MRGRGRRGRRRRRGRARDAFEAQASRVDACGLGGGLEEALGLLFAEVVAEVQLDGRYLEGRVVSGRIGGWTDIEHPQRHLGNGSCFWSGSPSILRQDDSKWNEE